MRRREGRRRFAHPDHVSVQRLRGGVGGRAAGVALRGRTGARVRGRPTAARLVATAGARGGRLLLLLLLLLNLGRLCLCLRLQRVLPPPECVAEPLHGLPEFHR